MAQEIVVGNKGAFEIVLKDDTQALEEVVVVGYAAQKKVNLTGSVASLNFTDEKLSRPLPRSPHRCQVWRLVSM